MGFNELDSKIITIALDKTRHAISKHGSEMQSSNYAIELSLPAIDEYAKGNTGVPYLYSFDSGRYGPHVMINALMHGNEICGATVVRDLLGMRLQPRCGRLTLAFANVAAYLRFDPEYPDRSRFIDQDLNRLWMKNLLEDRTHSSIELERARELKPIVDSVDLLLDIHSMHERSSPLLLAGPHRKGLDLARAIAVPSTIVVDEGHSDGCRLRDYAGFGCEDSPKNALLVECGQHWETASLQVARHCTARFLVVSGVVGPPDLPLEWHVPPQGASCVIRVTHAIVATSTDFKFLSPYKGLECIPRAGTVVGWNSGEPVATPYDDCVLVMPSLRQLRAGVTVVRFGTLQP